jgi:hypothetical protein
VMRYAILVPPGRCDFGFKTFACVLEDVENAELGMDVRAAVVGDDRCSRARHREQMASDMMEVLVGMIQQPSDGANRHTMVMEAVLKQKMLRDRLRDAAGKSPAKCGQKSCPLRVFVIYSLHLAHLTPSLY